MRWFFIAVGILAWIWALAVLWLFAEGGGALTIIAAGIFAVVAIVALGTERILKTLEEIRDGSVTRIRVNTPPERVVKEERVVTARDGEVAASAPLGTQSV
jgi:hypothetical protein